MLLAIAAGAALVIGPWRSGLDPTTHSYPATVWILVAWAVFHLAVGVVMHLYCVARRLARRLDARHDIDIANVEAYWHVCALEAAITALLIGGFPLVA